jgi:hypothetical protein
LSRAFAKADKQLKRDYRESLRSLAEPVKVEAQARATQEITNIGSRWSLMRVGVTQKLVYVAPQERGRASRRNVAIRRPNLATLLMDEAMQPALDNNAQHIEERFGDLLDAMATTWERA